MIYITLRNLLLASILLTYTAATAAVFVEGNVWVTVWVNGAEIKPVTATFQAELEPSKYHLSLQFTYLEGSGPLAQEISHEDGSTYQTTHWKPESLESAEKGGLFDNTVVAKAFQGTMPKHLTPIVFAPWIAYCSHIHNFNQPRDPTDYDYLLRGVDGANLKFMTGASPKLSFGIPEFKIIKPGQHSIGHGFKHPLPPPISPYIGVDFQPLTLANTNGITVISEAMMVYTNHTTSSHTRKTDFRITDQIILKLNSYKLIHSKPHYRPRLPKDTTVIDSRSGAPNGAVYEATSTGWLGQNDSETRERIFTENVSGEVHSTSNFWIASAVGVPTALLVLLALAKRK